MVVHVHLITVGAGILSNYLRSRYVTSNDYRIINDDNELFKRASPSSELFRRVYHYLLTDPRSVSPELNAIWNYIMLDKVDEVYLYATNTGRGVFCSSILEKYFYDVVKIRVHKVIVKDFGLLFESGLINLLDKISSKIIELKRNPNIKVYLNATGGFKPENAILYTIASLLRIDEIYYIHESFDQPVKLPVIPLSIDPSYYDILMEIYSNEIRHGFMLKSIFIENYGEDALIHLKDWNLIYEEDGKVKLRRWTKSFLKMIKHLT